MVKPPPSDKSEPPPPDALPGPIKYRPPQGKPEDRPLERVHQEFENHQKASRGDASNSPPAPAKIERK